MRLPQSHIVIPLIAKIVLPTIAFFAIGLFANAQSNTANYITETLYTEPSLADSVVTITYYDGLGRQDQTVLKGASPAGGDIVESLVYDACGRESEAWLPTPVLGNNGARVSTSALQSLTLSFYSDAMPKTVTTYDGSPLDRVKKTTGPGTDWHTAQKGLEYNYNNSHPSNSNSRVPVYTVIYANDMIVIQRVRYGTVGEHEIVISTDEDGRVTREFKDMFSQTVQSVQEFSNGNALTYLVTSYIYDNAGRLAGVLPPMLTASISSLGGSSWSSYSVPDILDYGYYYKYDSRGRMIAKKLPGCDWIYYVYDKGDRLVFSQDGEQRSSGKWSFYLHDQLGRECVSGLCSNSINYSSGPLDSLNVVAVRQNNGAYNGYAVVGTELDDPDVLSVKWWDDYSFIGENVVPSTIIYETPVQGCDERYAPSAQGLLTGSLERILANTTENEYLWTVTWYDDHGRVVQQRRASHRGGEEKEMMGYSFTGNLTKRSLNHVLDTTGTTMTESYSYYYDNWGRPTITHHSLNGGNSVVLVNLEYDGVGRVVHDWRNGAAPIDTRYTHNIRSWLTNIRVGRDNITGAEGGTFKQSLYYNSPRTSAGAAQWTGNISGMDWRVGQGATTHSYDFTYDGLSRLTDADYVNTSGATGSYDRAYGYDLNGNIVTIGKSGITTTSTHTGNKLTSHTTGYTTVAMTYDGNGRMITEGTNSLSYNEMGFLKAKAGSGAVTTWSHSSSGEKLQRKDIFPGTEKTDYVGNLIFRNDTLKTILVNGGFISVSYNSLGNPSYDYRFFVADHQGNNRLVTDANGTVLQVNHFDPYGELLPISVGTSESPFMYSRKEWDTNSGSYDFGARRYSVSFPSWTTMDPLSEKYYSFSPYAYCAANPMNLVDPLGKDYWILNRDGSISLFQKNQEERLYAVEGDRITGEYFLVLTKGLLEALSYRYSTEDTKEQMSMVDGLSGELALSLFKFLSDNSDVEWAMHGTNKFTVGTLHNSKHAGNWRMFGLKDVPLFSIHSHPGLELKTEKDRFFSATADYDSMCAAPNSKAQFYYIYFPLIKEYYRLTISYMGARGKLLSFKHLKENKR